MSFFIYIQVNEHGIIHCKNNYQAGLTDKKKVKQVKQQNINKLSSSKDIM